MLGLQSIRCQDGLGKVSGCNVSHPHLTRCKQVWLDTEDHPFAQDVFQHQYTSIGNFAQRRMAPTESETEHFVRKSIKSDGQGTMLFAFATRKRSHFSAQQKDVDQCC